MSQMRALPKLIMVQSRLYLREPIAVFFTLLLAPLLLIMMGIIIGNKPDPLFGGRGYLDAYVPAYAAMVIGIVSLTAVAIETATRRETGVLRRFRVTPLRPLVYIASDVLVYFCMIILGILLLFLLAGTVYRVRPEGSPLALMMGVSLSAVAFLPLGYVLAGLVRSARIATVIGNVLLYPMVILSGAAMPREVMPATVRDASRFIPLTHVVTLLRGLWSGNSLGDHMTEVAVLAILAVAGTLVAAWTFRWE